MLQAILNKPWMQYSTKQLLYGHLLPLSKTIQVKWMRHAGHRWRSKDKLINNVLLRTPTHGYASVGQLARTYLHQLCGDAGSSLEDLPGVMDDRDGGRERESQGNPCCQCNLMMMYTSKNIKASLLFIELSKTFTSIHKGNMALIRLAYGLIKETVTAKLMLYKSMNEIVLSLVGDTNFFNIVTGVLQRDKFALYLSIFCLDYVLPTFIDLIKENDFSLEKARYPVETITDADHADNQALLANTPAQTEYLLYSRCYGHRPR